MLSVIVTHFAQTSSQSRKDIASGDQSKVIADLKAKLAASEAKERDFGGFPWHCPYDRRQPVFSRDP